MLHTSVVGEVAFDLQCCVSMAARCLCEAYVQTLPWSKHSPDRGKNLPRYTDNTGADVRTTLSVRLCNRVSAQDTTPGTRVCTLCQVRLVAGYVVRDPKTTISTMKDDYTWNEEEIYYMKKQRMLDKTFNRRRDEQTHYMECRAFYEAMMGKPGS